MFDKAELLKRFRYKYVWTTPRAAAEGRVGEETTLGSDELRTLLLIVLRNATTDSPWPLTNNPAAKYNEPDRANNNVNIPLWRLVRASTAAPTYFPPEVMTSEGKTFMFVDGGSRCTTTPPSNCS